MGEQIYKTKDGTRVRVVKVKQHPIDGRDRLWLQEIHHELNSGYRVVRIKDGHDLWGICKEDLVKA